MLEDALARLEHQVQAVKRAVALFQLVHHPQALQIVFEAAMGLHAVIQGILAGVAERGVAEIVGQRDGFHQVFVQLQVAGDGAGDLRDFDAVRQARAEQVAFVVDEYLSLVFQPAKGGAMDDAVAVALEFSTRAGRFFDNQTSSRLRRMCGVGSKRRFLIHRGRSPEASC